MVPHTHRNVRVVADATAVTSRNKHQCVKRPNLEPHDFVLATQFPKHLIIFHQTAPGLRVSPCAGYHAPFCLSPTPHYQDAWFNICTTRTDKVARVGTAAFFTSILKLFFPDAGTGHDFRAGITMRVTSGERRRLIRFRSGCFIRVAFAYLFATCEDNETETDV
jgi:hypothetical protein